MPADSKTRLQLLKAAAVLAKAMAVHEGDCGGVPRCSVCLSVLAVKSGYRAELFNKMRVGFRGKRLDVEEHCPREAAAYKELRRAYGAVGVASGGGAAGAGSDGLGPRGAVSGVEERPPEGSVGEAGRGAD